MDQQHFRAVIAALLVVTVSFGIYLGWHYSHPAQKHCLVYVAGQGC